MAREFNLSPFIVDRRYDLIHFKAEKERSAGQLETAVHIYSYIRRAMSMLRLYDNTALTLTQWRQLHRIRLVSCQWQWVTQLPAIINFATWHCRLLELSPLGTCLVCLAVLTDAAFCTVLPEAWSTAVTVATDNAGLAATLARRFHTLQTLWS